MAGKRFYVPALVCAESGVSGWLVHESTLFIQYLCTGIGRSETESVKEGTPSLPLLRVVKSSRLVSGSINKSSAAGNQFSPFSDSVPLCSQHNNGQSRFRYRAKGRPVYSVVESSEFRPRWQAVLSLSFEERQRRGRIFLARALSPFPDSEVHLSPWRFRMRYFSVDLRAPRVDN